MVETGYREWLLKFIEDHSKEEIIHVMSMLNTTDDKEQFVNFLQNLSKEDIVDFTTSHVPPHRLYKYLPFEVDRYKTVDIFKTKQLWFSSPKDLDDPFDLSPEVRPLDKSVIMAHLENTSILAEAGLEASHKEEVIKGLSDHFMLSQIVERFNNDLRIGCFCSQKENRQLWALYADRNKGICLEFNPLEDKDFFAGLQKVRYQATRPQISILGPNAQIELFHSYRVKHSDWSSQHEHRIIKSDQINEHTKKNYYNFNPESLRTAIFGVDCRHEIQSEIIEVCKADPALAHVAFERAQKHASTYNFIFVKVKT